MSNTLKAVRRRMLKLDPTLGSVEALSALSGTTAVILRLGQGTTNDVVTKLTGKWVIRADATSGVDFARYIKSAAFSAGTGVTLTHDGTTYSDVTATSELCEILLVGTPWEVNTCINTALGKVRHEARVILPGYKGGRYYFGADSSVAPWVTEPSHVRDVTIRDSMILTQNGEFEQWNTRGTGGGLTPPDGWVLAGTSAAVARTTTNVRKGLYAAEITAAGGNVATLTQTVGLKWTGVSGDSLQSQAVIAMVAGTPDASSQVRVRISDGVGTTDSAYLTTSVYGSAVTAAHTLDASATTLTAQVRVEANGTPEIDRCELFFGSTISDNDYRAEWDPRAEARVQDYYDQSAGAPALWLEPLGLGRQYVVYSTVPYPQFDETRLVTDAAEADTTDAPLDTLATAALAEFWGTRDGAKGAYWRAQADAIMQAHTYRQEPAQGGGDYRPRVTGLNAWRPR